MTAIHLPHPPDPLPTPDAAPARLPIPQSRSIRRAAEPCQAANPPASDHDDYRQSPPTAPHPFETQTRIARSTTREPPNIPQAHDSPRSGHHPEPTPVAQPTRTRACDPPTSVPEPRTPDWLCQHRERQPTTLRHRGHPPHHEGNLGQFWTAPVATPIRPPTGQLHQHYRQDAGAMATNAKPDSPRPALSWPKPTTSRRPLRHPLSSIPRQRDAYAYTSVREHNPLTKSTTSCPACATTDPALALQPHLTAPDGPTTQTRLSLPLLQRATQQDTPPPQHAERSPTPSALPRQDTRSRRRRGSQQTRPRSRSTAIATPSSGSTLRRAGHRQESQDEQVWSTRRSGLVPSLDEVTGPGQPRVGGEERTRSKSAVPIGLDQPV